MAPDASGRVVVTLGDEDSELASLLGEKIYELNVAETGLSDGHRFSIRAEDDTGELVAGLSGWTWGGCGYVDVLWVAEGHRHEGLGTRLMDTAEAEAVAEGCARMLLTTHTFQGPDFYRRRGYVETGRITDYPQGHAQVQLRKNLSEGTPPS